MRANALVTGAAGFIGAHVTRALLEQGYCNPVALDDLSGGFEENLPPEVPFVRGSVTDAELMRSIFKKYDFRYVFHLAAYAAEGLSHFIRRFNYTNNVIGTVNLINEAVNHQVECFVFTSSIAVYGSGSGTPPFREDMAPTPEDPYGIAKFSAELDLKAANHMWGLPYVIFRPHNVYGEYQNTGDPYRNVVGIFMNQIMSGKPMTIFGDGEQQRAFTHVSDVAPIIARSPLTPAAHNQIFNLGSDAAYSVNTLARETAKAMKAPDHPIVHLDARKEVHIAFGDHSKAQRVFGHEAATSLEEGLARTAAWATSVGPRKSKPFDNIEVARNLPPSWRSFTIPAE